jgi:hypothetical protein
MMTNLKLYIDRKPVFVAPLPRLKNGEVLVPLRVFSQIAGAEVKSLEDNGKLFICRDDRCIPLDDSRTKSISIAGDIYVPLTAFANPLGLSWHTDKDTLWVNSSVREDNGLDIGVRAPDFTLPDLYTGELVSLRNYLGQKTVFFMWASW